jgi:UDP-N-acetylmuramoylalanine--D-glutamate ligase
MAVVAERVVEWVNRPGVDFLDGKQVLVIGLARSGRAAAELCCAEGAEVTAVDAKSREELSEVCDYLDTLGVRVRLNGDQPRMNFDYVVVSPGVPSSHELIVKAKKKDIPVWSELELAARCARCHLVAVTGTDGKTTTCTLTADMLRAHRKRVMLGGNIGTAFSSLLLKKEFVHSPHVVAEVSSYQLEHVEEFAPEVATILNIATDHLARHGEFETYRRTKWRIVENMDEFGFVVLRNDLADQIPEGMKPYPLFFGLEDEGREGGFWVGKKIVWRFNGETIEVPVKNKRKMAPPEKENAVAALTTAMAAGMELHKSVEVIQAFQPLPHRLEEVIRRNGVRFVNDSKATNVHSTLAALNSMKPPVVLIAGGKDKGEDFAPLVKAAKGKVRTAILMGETANSLAAHLVDATQVQRVATLKEAVKRACAVSKKGDTVLFAPACPSQDMFSDFEERGEAFATLVKEKIGA